MRLIDADAACERCRMKNNGSCGVCIIGTTPTVDAVEVEDKKLLKAIKMLIKQYDHSKQSEYVHSPVAHALFHTWKKVDGDGNA